jgi:uncharacterized membrane protein YidH (DUF202 family)
MAMKARDRMYRGAGTGLVAFGLVLVVLGAILNWAVTVTTTGFNINTIGVILFVVGIISAVIGIALFAFGTNHRAISRESVQYTPNGRERVLEHHDVMP